jgi:aspartyl-tRNA(Asn)/glutamyl-tRNA(Gln) amidotransferase subunit C
MALITRDEVRKIAKISCIEVQESELDLLADELEAVLRYASSLKAIADNAQATAPVLHTVNITREDETRPFDSKKLVALAPQHEENFFVVPVIVKQ